MKVTLQRGVSLLLAAVLAFGTGCSKLPGGGSPADTGYTRYSTQFYDTFDTIIQVIGYAETQEEFEGYAGTIHQRFQELSQLYDRFYEYSGVNNIRTINLNAGVAPVEVEPELLEMLSFAKEWCQKTQGRVNIAMGPVLEIWHQYRDQYSGQALAADAAGALPSMEALDDANHFSSLDKVIIDREKGTVFLEDKKMALDVGAVAKGYAAQLVADEIYEAGFRSFTISAGGNVITKDPPLDGVRNSWGIGIQDPFADLNKPDSQSLDVALVSNRCVVTSGDYRQFYTVGDQLIHHIIDPATLWPANQYRALTVVCEDSGLGDFLSTCLFVMDYDEGRALAEELGVGVLWVFPDGRVEVNDNLLPLLRDRGGATNAITNES
ncbi:MAG: FAD:protein FMN transferase [Angelakisella sp.]|jgi:thiamine biosynthesis lipoprotein|nr:FAD:protein FMN transferase [Angelakisella sp.]